MIRKIEALFNSCVHRVRITISMQELIKQERAARSMLNNSKEHAN
jgi:hypothetical protein